MSRERAGRYRPVILLSLGTVLAAFVLLFAHATGASGMLRISFVTCSPTGYSFIVSGSGYAPNMLVVIWDMDNSYPGPPPAAQLFVAQTDASGSFATSVTTGAAQTLPATVVVTSDFDGQDLLSGPIGAIPPDCSTLSASPSSIVADGSTTSAISLQVRDASGNLVGAAAGGRGVRFSTSLGTFPAGCTAGCLATDNGDGTYSLPLTSSTSAGSALVSATIADPTYGTVQLKDTALVGFSSAGVQASPATSTISVNPSSVIADGSSTVAVMVQTKSASGVNLTGGGNSVTLSTTAGTFSGGCTAGCPATDNGDGTYSATLIAATSPTMGFLTGKINGASMSSSASVTFGSNTTGGGGGGPGPSARSLNQFVIAGVLSLSSTRKPDNDRLYQIGADLTDVLMPSNWVSSDGNHVSPGTGDRVFSDEQDAVNHFRELLGDPNTQIANPTVVLSQPALLLLQAERLLAATAIADASCPSCDPKPLGQATKELASGDASVPFPPGPPGPKKPDSVSHYRNAWDAAEQATRYPCSAVGEVQANGHIRLSGSAATAFAVASGTLLSFEVEGDCDLDKSTSVPYLQHAHVTIQANRAPPLVAAQTDQGVDNRDVTVVTAGGSDATVSGTSNGQTFTVTLHDGGRGAASDTARIQLGSADTGLTALTDGDVHVDNT